MSCRIFLKCLEQSLEFFFKYIGILWKNLQEFQVTILRNIQEVRSKNPGALLTEFLRNYSEDSVSILKRFVEEYQGLEYSLVIS